MSRDNHPTYSVAARRNALGWSQDKLSARAGVPRSSVSAMEAGRLTPSVAAALAISRALECSVEELFGAAGGKAGQGEPAWAWTPLTEPCRYWEAEVGGRRLLYPVESLAVNATPHDGLWQEGIGRQTAARSIESTLVIASCDPAAGLLAAEYARASDFRLVVLQRGGDSALDLLKRGLVHVAGVHRSTSDAPARNAEAVRRRAGDGYRLLRVADWQEGLALPAHDRSHSLPSIARRCDRWALREPGSAARECLDEMLGRRTAPGRVVSSHAAVAEAVHSGWAGAGVCVQLTAEDAGLHFLPLRTESLDFVFAEAHMPDPRVQALIRLLRSRPHRRLLSELPGYDARHTGELLPA